MAKELFISSTPHETKVAVVEDERLAEIYFERENEYTLAGSIYKGRVTRVLPGMQSAFVDIGLERDAFLYVTDFLEEQEDQEDFEQVSGRAHSDAQQQQPQSTRQPSAPSAEPSGTSEPESQNENESGPGSDRGPRRWRGRRGRRRRGSFPEQQQSDASAASPENVEEGADESDDSVVLPGESLSKYRQGDSAEAEGNGSPREAAREEAPQQHHRQEPPSTQPPTPQSSSSFSVLPGESISKYRGRSQTEEAQPGSHRPPASQERSGRSPRWERPNRRPERERWEAAPSGPPVFALPGESLAKYRNESTTPSTETASPEMEQSRAIVPDAVTSDGSREDLPRQLSGASTESSAPSSVSEENQPVAHEFGSGVIEEEVIEEEETEIPTVGDHLDEEIYEELEEETLDAENAEQLVEAVREAHVIQRLGLRDHESSDGEDHAVEEGESFLPQNGTQEEEDEPLFALKAAAEQEAESDSAGEEDEEDQDNEQFQDGRAELRAPASTAGFQQRVERPERNQHDRFRRGRGRRPMRGRRNIQRESQPTISELLKEGQEILVQIAKEPMAKKGARITSHIALPGRFLVYMPTVNHVGVSRKIGSDEERQRLKRVLISEKGNAHGGFIVRTAAAGASEEDLRSDLRFLINLWNDIKSRAENSKAPALIYHDLNLVERILRDQVTSNFTSIWMDSEQEYERIVRFLGRFQSSMVRRAKLYTKDTPLFEQFGIHEEINNALKSKVWLKSGGYIVINQTEALVAIDINTGKYVGKTQRLEDTIVKTNVDAIKEIVRQIRLRDLGGIIVIDFIDMDERRNRQKVMQALEEELKNDRAPSKVLQFNDFGLVAITRKRVKQSLERTLSTACVYCSGTGMIKSVQTVCNEIYVEMRKMSRQFERHDVMLRVNPEVVKALKASNGRWLQEMEELTGKTIIVKSDPLLHQEQFDIN
ncbi:MAG: Rne/Rng family ribonuclease [Acidobacteria bacterium]|nr:Rne/Rng family ribonuclease [Acidobacteriota bacterium]